jgi:hypothetical protein
MEMKSVAVPCRNTSGNASPFGACDPLVRVALVSLEFSLHSRNRKLVEEVRFF